MVILFVPHLPQVLTTILLVGYIMPVIELVLVVNLATVITHTLQLPLVQTHHPEMLATISVLKVGDYLLKQNTIPYIVATIPTPS